MTIKVCHFTSTHQPKDQRIFYKECISLAKAGYEVTLVEQGKSEVVDGVNIVGTGESRNNRYYRLLVRPFVVYKLAKSIEADIYHFHDMELIPYGLMLKKIGKKVIFDYHEDYAGRFADSDALFGPKWLRKSLGKLYCMFESYSVKQFDAIISVTPHVCDRLKEINFKTYMITNYPLLDNENWKNNTKYNKISDYIVFAGQISDTYCLDSIVKAIQEVPEVKFKMCGPERKLGYIDFLKKADINNKIEYLGIIPYMELPQYLINAKCAFVLSQYCVNSAYRLGTLGNNKLFEAMLCGIPVVCTNFELWKDIIDKYRCGIYVENNNLEEIKNAIIYIINNPLEAEEMGKRGRFAVLERYNWKTQEIKLLNLYEELKK